MHEIFQVSERISVLPVIHGSGDFALEVRRVMLEESFDCLAVPLPGSFQENVETAILRLPTPAAVTQAEAPRFSTQWSPDSDDDCDDDDDEIQHSYVPIDPCQPVIAALRIALQEHLPRHFIDLETAQFEPVSDVFPDPYALKQVKLERFAAAVLPQVGELLEGQPRERVLHMGWRLAELQRHYERILLVCSVVEWPWIRQAYQHAVQSQLTAEEAPQHDVVEEVETFAVDPQTLIFLLGELPFITGLYERARAELEDDANLAIDGVKELLIAARETYRSEFKGRARRVTPHLLRQTLKYLRNLTLLERRMTPDLYSIIIAAKQVLGDQYARHVAEQAREYGQGISVGGSDDGQTTLKMSVDRARLPGGDVVGMVSRLPGPPVSWRNCNLKRKPERVEQEKWQQRWNPFGQCSWPPEDELIENFRTHVAERAKQLMGADLVRTEKFTTSVMDGIDIRDTLRNWHTGDIYVKVLPPARGALDCVVMLFDSPADPRDYPWRTTWYAEHQNESTLAFFATNFGEELIGPGIAVANYGGCLFLFPPMSAPDIWHDPTLDFAETLEERILAAACVWSRCRHIAVLSPGAPGAGWRRLAKQFGKRLVHVPLANFGDGVVQQLRTVHVLNGKQVRSYAADFIRKA